MMRACSPSSPLVRCVAPPSTAQQIYGVRGQQQQQQQQQSRVYGDVVAMTQLTRRSVGDLLVGAPAGALQSSSRHCPPPSWTATAGSIGVITRSVCTLDNCSNVPMRYWLCGRMPAFLSGGCRFESRHQGLLSLPSLRGRKMSTSCGWGGKGRYGSFRLRVKRRVCG